MSYRHNVAVIPFHAHLWTAPQPSRRWARVEAFLWMAMIAFAFAMAAELVMTLRAQADVLSRLFTVWPWS
jgi:hypothetical protein